MLITSKNIQNKKKRRLTGPGRYRLKAILAGLLVLGTLLSLVVYKITVQHFPRGIKSRAIAEATKYGFRQLDQKARFKDALLRLPGNLSNSVETPRVVIDIKFKHIQTLQSIRDEALKRGVLNDADKTFFPARIRYKDENIKVKLRLKGDWTDHLEGKKWSFRIHVKGKNHLFGMRRFSIQNPKTRGFQSEKIFLETLRKYGVLTPRYFFVHVTLNGDDIGLMALEEHFSKELLEYNQRREGVILKYDESLVWAATDGVNRGFRGTFDDYQNASIAAFRSNKIKRSGRLSRELAAGVGLLRSFKSGELSASDVFNARQLGSFLAVSEFFRAVHAVRWHNLRFYFNPIAMKLEPIGFDSDINHPTNSLQPLYKIEPILGRMMEDEHVKHAYAEALEAILRDFHSGELIEYLKDIEAASLSQLRKEFYFIDGFDFDKLQQFATVIENGFDRDIDPVGKYPVLINAHIIHMMENTYIEIINAIDKPVEIMSLLWQNDKGNEILFRPKSFFDLPYTLYPRNQMQHSPISKKIYYHPPEGGSYKLKVVSRIKGYQHQKVLLASDYFPPTAVSPIPTNDLEDCLVRNPFLGITQGKALFVEPGVWEVHGNIIVPADFTLNIPGGVTLYFEKTAGIIAFGNLNFTGSKEKPIVLSGNRNDISSDQPSWQGIVVMNSSKHSNLNFTHIVNTTGIHQGSWILTCGTTFYYSDVTINNCSFSNNNTEDALNIIHSKFVIQDIQFENTASDAFDSDFSDGEISGGEFYNIGLAGGGDGIDVSGSKISLTGIKFRGISDKAVSVGEGSLMTANNLNIVNAGAGVVSKDNSNVTITDSSIEESLLAALMTYVKKPEYGPSILTGNNLSISNNTRQVIAQDGTSMVVNGERINTQALDVENLYQTLMKPGMK